LKREADGLTVHFEVTDTAKTVPVVYKGILPDLFKEGKGVVAQASSKATARSTRPKCSQSMTKITCRRPRGCGEQGARAMAERTARTLKP
jgi:hypothetical protein